MDELANGPFAPDTPGNLDETGYPTKQDMAKAQELIASYKAENPGPLNLALATTQDETNLTNAQFKKQWYEEAGVDNVTIDQIDQGNYILTAASGNFQTFQWRNHSGFDLDDQYIWWHSSSRCSCGRAVAQLRADTGPRIDELLDLNRAETDPAKKQEYAEEVNRSFARGVLQPVGRLGHLGRRPQAHRPRCGELHPPRRPGQPVRSGDHGDLLSLHPVGRAVIGVPA